MHRQLWLIFAVFLVAAVRVSDRSAVLAQEARPATPADGLVGQQVTACTYDADLAVTVTGVDWTPVVADGVAPDGSSFVVALLAVTNLADKTEALTSRPLELVDAAGTHYLVQEDPPDASLVAEAYGVQPPWQEFDPGVTTASVVTFLVPGTVDGLTLLGRRDYCAA
ncbi:MAG TPA: hypothetical protein VFD32_13805 [Dehalococcoidia bacterium]|nr:hypothetical protein [Dehalococcoidia bacterium]